MATKRDYALEYERRRIRANYRGFSSPAEETAYNRAKKAATTQGKKLTVYNFRRSRQAALKNARIQKSGTKAKFKKQSKYETLRLFRISENKLNQLRKQNRAFSRKTQNPKLRYDLTVDSKTSDFSEARVGYIVGYNQVFVNPKTKNVTGKNREKLVGKYLDLIEKYGLFADLGETYGYAGERKAA